MKKIFTAILLSSLMLSACARNMSSSTYKSGESGGKVVEGVIISARNVQINESDKLGDNAMGGLAGGVAGGVGGSAIGKGRGQAAATVGGAIAGALLGAVIQDQLSKSDGIEYIVKISSQNQSSYDKNNKKSRIVHERKDDVKDTITTNMKTNLISVVQGAENPLQKGQKVFVIYSDNGRPRVIAAN